jgi:hypothetical protein
MKYTKFICAELAWIAALVYLMIGAGLIDVPGLGVENFPPILAYLAAGTYAIGGALILFEKRWLRIYAITVNTFVIVMFYGLYAGNTGVIFSVPGLATIISQITIEAGLTYLIIKSVKKEHRVQSGLKVKHA